MGFIYHSARYLTGGTATSLDSLATSVLEDGNDHFCWTADAGSSKVYLHVFDSASTDPESSPDIIRPDDYTTGGTWVLQSSPFDVSAGIEIGTLLDWPIAATPLGYLECNGAEIDRTLYTGLFSIIGITYGSGDGVNTFNLPDFRGLFARGWDHGAAIDPDATTRTDRGDGVTGDFVGTKQVDQLKSHRHTYNGIRTWNAGEIGQGNGEHQAFGYNTSYTGGLETRPKNINVMRIIKY